MRPCIFLARALLTLYAGAGLLAMWLAPRVPYADAWRFLAHFLQAPFPQDILAPDNGHHEVLPNAVRVIELHAFAAQQWLQVAVGMALALATVAVLWRRIRIQADPMARAASLLAIVLGLFWLGNIRALAHGNETVHAYCVMLFLVLGLHALTRPHAQDRGIAAGLVAAACGIAAAFSFGSGIACFVAFAVVLGLRRAPWREWVPCLLGLPVALLLLQWSGGNDAEIGIAPLLQAERLLRWLAGPFVQASWPLLDPAVAAQIPVAGMRESMHAAARAYEAAFGTASLARWPHLLVGMAGLCWLGTVGWRAWKRPTPAALAGIGLACFAAAVGAMIVLVRSDYFDMHPEQLLAPRYVVWSSLFWAGLALATIAQAQRPTRALAWTVAVALALLPSQFWMAELGARMRTTATQTALAAAVGVLDPDLPLGETVPAELAAALPLLREARAGMYAWPETRWLGRRPAPERRVMLDAHDIRVTRVDNRLGAPGRRVRFVLADAPAERVLLLDRDGVVRGIAMREHGMHWLGWMRGAAPDAAALRVAVATAP